MKSVVIYGKRRVVDGRSDPTFDSFDPRDGEAICLVGVPDDAVLRQCDRHPEARCLELFCSAIDHAGPEAVVSFALDDDDPDFRMALEYVPIPR